MPDKIFNRRHLNYFCFFFFFFAKKNGLILPADCLLRRLFACCEVLFSRKIRENIASLSSAEYIRLNTEKVNFDNYFDFNKTKCFSGDSNWLWNIHTTLLESGVSLLTGPSKQ